MSYRVPSLDELHNFLIAFWKALFPGSNVQSRFSYHWKRLKAYAGGITDLHAHVQTMANDIMLDTSTGTYLTRWGRIFNVPKKTATPARGENALRCYGNVAAAVTTGDQLTDPVTGLTFEVAENGAVPVAGTYIDVDVRAVSTGAATRLRAGTSLQFVAPPAGIQAVATLVKDLDEDGFDEEQEGAYSARVNARVAKPKSGGNQDDFVAWALEVAGVDQAFAYPNRAGVGTMDVVGLHNGSGSARALSSTERSALLAYLKKKAPSQISGTGGGLRVLETLVDGRTVEILVSPDGSDAAEFDWVDEIAPTISAFAAQLVTLNAARPASMQAGHRFVVKGVGSVQDGRVFTIDALHANADKFYVKEVPPVNFAATDIVYAGGPLTKLVRDAIVAHMNGEIVYADKGQPTPASVAESQKRAVGLKPLAYGIGTANPAGKYGTWSGALNRSVLDKIATYATGVRKVEIPTPAADYEAADPVFPNDSQIYFVGPSVVLVRRKW